MPFVLRLILISLNNACLSRSDIKPIASDESIASTWRYPRRLNSSSSASARAWMTTRRGSGIVELRWRAKRGLISNVSNVASAGSKSSMARGITPVPGPNSTTTRAFSSGNGRSMARVRYFELGAIAPTVPKSAIASATNAAGFINPSWRRKPPTSVGGGGVLHYNAPEGKWLSRLRFAGAIQTPRDVTSARSQAYAAPPIVDLTNGRRVGRPSKPAQRPPGNRETNVGDTDNLPEVSG